jgi:hypothetical protein
MAYVSDHALLRYLERVEKIDIEAIRRKLSVNAIDTAAAFGCETVLMGDGTRLKLHGDVVSTVIGKRESHRGRH